jgi:DMSO/TMAO reductase YedYZ molybdopterin-dependent catalytic subunit
LLFLVPLAVLTGLFANTVGTEWWPAPAAVHGIVAFAIVALVPWKASTVRRGLGRTRSGRPASLLLLVLVLVAMASGLLHSTGSRSAIGPLTVMQVHIGSALLALGLIAAHARSRPVAMARADLDRRAFLGTATLGVVGVVTWHLWEGLLQLTGSSGAGRRFTGSHERGSFDPQAMPVTSWLDDRAPDIDPGGWTIRVDGRPLTLAQLAALPQDDVTAILDCTSGWYSEQVWTGVRLDRLVATDSASIVVRSATGYGRRFPARDAARMWLVTAAGGRPLSRGHGAPARLVAPGRRGFWWVKWVESVEPSASPWWRQLPFPAT